MPLPIINKTSPVVAPMTFEQMEDKFQGMITATAPQLISAWIQMRKMFTEKFALQRSELQSQIIKLSIPPSKPLPPPPPPAPPKPVEVSCPPPEVPIKK